MPLVQVGDLSVYYELVGQGDPLVLIAGLGQDHTSWLPQLGALADAGFCSLLPDNRDVGQTTRAEPAPPYTIRDCAEDTVGLMESLGLASAHLVGASMGACIAQEIAIGFPDRVRSLTLMAGFPAADPMLAEILASWKTLRSKFSPEEFLPLIWPWLYSWRLFRKPARLQAGLELAAASPFPQSAAGYCRQCEALAAHDALDRLGQIRAPTHVIVGEEDILAPTRHSRTLAQRIPGARLTVLPEVAHAFSSEAPAAANAALVGFLKARQ